MKEYSPANGMLVRKKDDLIRNCGIQPFFPFLNATENILRFILTSPVHSCQLG